MKKILAFSVSIIFVLTACNQPKPVKTTENLKAGITGETTASAKYAAFAQKSREEGNNNIAKLFEAASKSESIHAANHGKVLSDMKVTMTDFKPVFEVKTTKENLEAAIQGESYEVQTMYPQFLTDARTEKNRKAEKSFTWASDTEKKHAAFYKQALDALGANNESSVGAEYMVCPVCGNTYLKSNADEKCSFCQTEKGKFISI
jgi:rubrerythrin